LVKLFSLSRFTGTMQYIGPGRFGVSPGFKLIFQRIRPYRVSPLESPPNMAYASAVDRCFIEKGEIAIKRALFISLQNCLKKSS